MKKEEIFSNKDLVVDSLNPNLPTKQETKPPPPLVNIDDEDAKFDLSSKDDEIEESPIKREVSFKVHNDLTVDNLRLKFQFLPAKLAEFTEPTKKLPSLNNRSNVKHSRQVLKDKSTSVNQNTTRGILKKPASITTNFKPTLHDKVVKFGQSKPFSKVQIASSQVDEYELSEDELSPRRSLKEPAPFINLKQFAFRK